MGGVYARVEVEFLFLRHCEEFVVCGQSGLD